MKKLAILGSTGSIGTSTLSICESFPDRYQPIALATGQNLEAALAQCVRWRPQVISIATEELASALQSRLKTAGISGIEVVHGTAGTVHVATLPEVDFVVSAIVGVAGLDATYAAVKAGKTIGLANKECLVAAGELIIAAAKEHNVALLPIDSEHNAVHQCMRGGEAREVRQIWLTASGGPFRNTPLSAFESITPAQALKHPTWVMGQRITIDSATMMNKGFEVIEACRLFSLPASQVRVTIHPQSTVHSMVEFIDGSILAQISVTDMRLPILYALAYPERVDATPARGLQFDLSALSQLDFFCARSGPFPLPSSRLRGSRDRRRSLHRTERSRRDRSRRLPEGQIPFMGIPRTIEQVLQQTSGRALSSIQEVLEADLVARARAREVISHQLSDVLR